MKMKNIIYMVEKNIHGAWAVYGVDGIKQYYGYTKKQAIEMYIRDCKTIYTQI